MLEADGFRNQRWVKWRIKDGHKGPMVWEVKSLRFHAVDADGMPGEPMYLIVARDVLNPAELKFFVSNAPLGTPVPTMLLVAFSRWRVERCFEDQKSEIGLDQYEGRRYRGLKRHMILSCVSYLFLSRMRQEIGGGKSGTDGVPDPHGGGGADPILVVEPAPSPEAVGADLGRDHTSAAPERRGAKMPHQEDTPKATRFGHQAHHVATLQVGQDLAL
jgi:hypothetical protein